MAQTLPSWGPSWLQARETMEAAIPLLTIQHAQIETYRFARNTVDIVSNGLTYSAAMFDFDIVSDNGKEARSQLSFPNVDPEIGKVLRSLVGPAIVTIEVINHVHPDEPIYRAALMKLKNINVDPFTFTGDLVRADESTETCGTILVSPARMPALFRKR